MYKTIIFMGLISTILNFFGYSGQPEKSGIKLPNEVEEQLEQSIEAFKNRPNYKELTENIIDTTSDDELLQVVFDNLIEKLPKNYEKVYETVLTWNKSRQAIYMIWALEAEVNNGGFNQFYANPSGQFYKLLPQSLRLVGADKFADLTQRANDLFEKEKEKITEHQDGTLEGFGKSYENNPLDDFDDEFYELGEAEDLQQIQVDYIRKNKDEFIDKSLDTGVPNH